jgi:hypothetical protein
MILELQQVLSVREVRLAALQALLAQRLQTLAAIDAELAKIDAELRQIADQRAIWERHWQRWLHEDHVLQHGRDYNLSHMALSSWEREAQAVRVEIAERQLAAAAEVQAAKKAVMQAQTRVEALGTMLSDARRRQRARGAALLDSRAVDELASRAGTLRVVEAAEKREGVL